MSAAKTRQTDEKVYSFLDGVEPESKRKDCQNLLGMMEEITQLEPTMWGENIVGFGKHVHSKNGTELPLVGFAPRKKAITIYVMPGTARFKSQLNDLGPHTTSKVCVYIKKLEDVDQIVLRKLIQDSAEITKTIDLSTAD
jgi:hypothetical protein